MPFGTSRRTAGPTALARSGCTGGSAGAPPRRLAAVSTSGCVPGAGPGGACAVRDADARPEARSYLWAGRRSEAGIAAKAAATLEAQTPAGAGAAAREPWSRDPRTGRLRAAAGVHRGYHAQAAARSPATGPACAKQVTRRVLVDVIGIPSPIVALPGRDAVPTGLGPGEGGDRMAHCLLGLAPPGDTA